MIPDEFLVPYLVANGFAFAVLAVAFWRPQVVRWLAVAVFAWASVTNTRAALAQPALYLDYAGLTASSLYRNFILGWFSQHVRLIVVSIAAGQLVIAALLASPRVPHRRLGTCGALVFLLAIAPLGVGAGFPFPLTFGAALLLSLDTLRVRSSWLQRGVWWTPRVFGLAFCGFLALLALDALRGGQTLLEALPDFAVHLLPAAIVLGAIVVAWRSELLGAIVFFALAITYALLAPGYLSWLLVISGPLVIEGLLFLWSWRHHDDLHAHG
jgi:hypothetical protein